MKEKNMIFGIHPVMEAIKENKDFDKVLIQRDAKGPMLTGLRKMLKEYKIPSQNLPIQRLNQISRKNHQGVIAFLSPISFQPLDNLVVSLFERGTNPLILILDRVSDVRNFGAICRTAECTGVDAVVVPVKGSAQVSADAVKTSSGALLKINLCREKSLPASVEYLKNSGFKIIGCTEKTENLIYDADYSGPTAIIMGSEEDGISSPLMKLLDKAVKIPMKGEIASLNVSVSTAVTLYEAIRQRAFNHKTSNV